MTATEILAELALRGVQLKADGKRLRYRPHSAMTADLLADLSSHKTAILALITSPKMRSFDGQRTVFMAPDLAANPQPCPACGSGVLWRLPGGKVVCECYSSVSAGSQRLVLAQLPSGSRWELFPEDDEADPIGDDWADAHDPVECPQCGAIDCWWDGLDNRHCMKCDPPSRKAIRFMNNAKTICRRHEILKTRLP
ncbi:MAG: hypothetical protein JXM70_00765 [Pirellulales bacterium]|nr:hypothetical protein [Pirellulales bacterium]